VLDHIIFFIVQHILGSITLKWGRSGLGAVVGSRIGSNMFGLSKVCIESNQKFESITSSSSNIER
jgi:hypothetical protein